MSERACSPRLPQALKTAARARAGDPGPVVIRRLNNAEYTFTIRDLTGVSSLDPAKEFPADGAAGEGFMNTGNALAMSPSLVTKYMDAAKNIAESRRVAAGRHPVLTLLHAPGLDGRDSYGNPQLLPILHRRSEVRKP